MLVIKHLSRTACGARAPPCSGTCISQARHARTNGKASNNQRIGICHWLETRPDPPSAKMPELTYYIDANLTLLLSFFRYVTLRPHRPYLGDRLAPT